MADGERPASDPREPESPEGDDSAEDDADAADVGEDSDAADAGEESDNRRHVLVAYDGTPQSEAALEHACRHRDDTRLTLLHAIDPVAAGVSTEVSLPSTAPEWYESARERADALLSEAAATAAGHGLAAETVVEVGRPAAAVVEYAEAYDVDHVVIGSHGRTGLSRVLVGSVAEAVVRRSPVPVTVVR